MVEETGAWPATVHGLTKSRTWLRDWTITTVSGMGRLLETSQSSKAVSPSLSSSFCLLTLGVSHCIEASSMGPKWLPRYTMFICTCFSNPSKKQYSPSISMLSPRKDSELRWLKHRSLELISMTKEMKHQPMWLTYPYLASSGISVLSILVTPWTVTHQAPLSMGFSRQEYWSGLPFLSPPKLGVGWGI